jgi:hypothetical protein
MPLNWLQLSSGIHALTQFEGHRGCAGAGMDGGGATKAGAGTGSSGAAGATANGSGTGVEAATGA